MELKFKLEVFEGPLDLLLHLIEKNKLDIYDIPIAEITDQYVAYVREMARSDLDVASEFLVMAAQLLMIKSKILLPKPKEDEEDTDPEILKEELERRLRGRATDTESAIEGRLIRARQEYQEADFYDYLIINDDVDRAAAKLSAIIEAEHCRFSDLADWLRSH